MFQASGAGCARSGAVMPGMPLSVNGPPSSREYPVNLDYGQTTRHRRILRETNPRLSVCLHDEKQKTKMEGIYQLAFTIFDEIDILSQQLRGGPQALSLYQPIGEDRVAAIGVPCIDWEVRLQYTTAVVTSPPSVLYRDSEFSIRSVIDRLTRARVAFVASWD